MQRTRYRVKQQLKNRYPKNLHPFWEPPPQILTRIWNVVISMGHPYLWSKYSFVYLFIIYYLFLELVKNKWNFSGWHGHQMNWVTLSFVQLTIRNKQTTTCKFVNNFGKGYNKIRNNYPIPWITRISLMRISLKSIHFWNSVSLWKEGPLDDVRWG